MTKEVLVIGSTPAGLQAARNLADCGLMVNLVESSPYIGEEPGDQEPVYLQNARLLEILKHPNIKTWTDTEVISINKENGEYQIQLNQNPRYIDLSKCTACGDCIEVCPVTIPGTSLKAIHFGGQPDCVVIAKNGVSPCSNACPAGIHVQGYVALIADGRYLEAYDLIHDALPFPSVCGRVCNHYCEESCSRLKIDEAVNIMALKRFVADRAYEIKDEVDQKLTESLASSRDKNSKDSSGKKVAIIGAGPAGLTAARDLIRVGHQVKIFDANPLPGGMMRVGIPPHRISYEQLDWEIKRILAEGIELQLNTWVDDIPGLLKNGFDAVLIATGAHEAVKIPIENADHPDNWLSLDFLKRVCLEEELDLKGRKVIVLGGGDVAMDAARAAVRLGTPEVRLVCRGLRASFNEINEAEEEGIKIIRNRVFKKVILDNGDIAGVECLEAEVGEVIDGKRQFTELPGTEHLIPGDLVIWAVGQRSDLTFLPEDEQIKVFSKLGIQTDKRMMTTLDGVFSAGDVRRGTTFFVVDAVGEGHHAARAIEHFLDGKILDITQEGPEEVNLSLDEIKLRLDQRALARTNRIPVPCISVSDRENNFSEVELTLGEKEIRLEAGRCLMCGPCSECMACVVVCEPGAVLHNQAVCSHVVNVRAVITTGEKPQAWNQLDLNHISHPDPVAGSAAAFQVMKEEGQISPLQLRETNPSATTGNKTGLVVCQCGGEISNALDTSYLCKSALSWPEISLAQELPFSCNEDAAKELKKIIRENNLDRLILAACTCCSLDQVCFSCTYQRIRCKENLGVFSSLLDLAEIEFVNIREQCAWAHPRSRKKATEAAKVLIRSALARNSKTGNREYEYHNKPITTLVLGYGASAEFCLKSLDELGLDSEAIEVLTGNIIRTGGQYLVQRPDGEFKADFLVLAPGSGAELDHITKSVLLTNQSPFLAGDRADLDTLEYGLVICPPDLDPEISGQGAAALVYAWVNGIANRIKQPAAKVDWLRCRACNTCVEICGYGIPEIVVDDVGTFASINPALCLDCGVCSAHCPSGAITPGTLTDSELEDMLEIILS